MIHQNCLRYYQSIVYKDSFAGLVDNDKEGIDIANHIKNGGKRARAIMMANHGVTMIGSNCAEALEDLYYLERAAMVQVLAMQAVKDPEKDLKEISPKMCELTYKQINMYPEKTRYSESLFKAWKDAGR